MILLHGIGGIGLSPADVLVEALSLVWIAIVVAWVVWRLCRRT